MATEMAADDGDSIDAYNIIDVLWAIEEDGQALVAEIAGDSTG